jgi:hypothetical protein
MKLKGILDFSLGNFLCLRGFAPMGDLYDISEPDPGFQRDLLKEHEREMVAFLRDGEFLFFPEVILATTLSPDETDNESVRQLYEDIRTGRSFANLKFPDYRIACKIQKTKSGVESRAYDVFQTGTMELNTKFTRKFSRIDGNHRLSATPKDKKFRAHNTPFCLLLFRNREEAAKFSRALFHNINYKAVPLTMEQNLKLILDDEALFPDEKLKEHEFFGWPYYHARKVFQKLTDDYAFIPNLRPFIENEPRTFLLRQFEFLITNNVLNDNENGIKRFKEALGKVNGVFDASPALKTSKNLGLLAALIYYELNPRVPVSSFVHWVVDNHLHLIPSSHAPDLIAIFDKVLESRKRTIFVSMPFGKDAAENHYKIIERVAKEVSEHFKLRPALKVERVDWLQHGTSYNVRGKIDQFMSECGLLIGNLTYCNPNVYHEIGFMDGKAKALGQDAANVLLFLDESVPDDKDKFVGFNLRGTKHIPFTQTEVFAKMLRENLERFFKLKP